MQEMFAMQKRLVEWRKSRNMDQKEAATHLGIPYRTYQNYESSGSNYRAPNRDAMEAFARAGINLNWLMTGVGGMMFGESAEPHPPAPQHQAEEPIPSGYVAVPLYNGVRAAAGHGAVVEHEAPDDALMFKEDWIRFELGTRPEDLRLIRVSGDSMEPTLRSGDVILIDHSATRPDREGIYILRMDGMLLVKRVQAMPGGILNISSDNAAFAPWQLTRADLEGSDVCIVGRVVWAGRRF